LKEITSDVETLFRRCYDAFNRRDLDGALALMHPDVTWQNGWEGGWVNGRDGVRSYWQRQWSALDPRVEPRGIVWDDVGRVTISAHQQVRDLTGNILSDSMVTHVYELRDGLVWRMEIR
jgi:ketosteroid isomerase-like protein